MNFVAKVARAYPFKTCLLYKDKKKKWTLLFYALSSLLKSWEMANDDKTTPSAHNERQHLSAISTRPDALHSEDPTLVPSPSATTPIPSSLPEKAVAQPDNVKIDLRDHLTPHNDPHNPFAFVPDQLSALMDPKNLPLLYSYSGLEGLAKGLQVDLNTGLIPNSKVQTPVSLNDVMALRQANHAEAPQEPRPRARSMTILSNATGATKTEGANAFPQRAAVFGSNILPEVKSKSIFELMWIAFQDKTLVSQEAQWCIIGL